MMTMLKYQTQMLNSGQNYSFWPQQGNPLLLYSAQSHHWPPLLFSTSSSPNTKANRHLWKPPKKSSKYFPRRSFHKKSKPSNTSANTRLLAPLAPRNTTSFIIRAKRSGGIASSSSPCPVTPALLPTPILSPSKELVVEMAKEQWGVDGYGSMKGLIRLRQSTSSVVDQVHPVEHDDELSRFEMVYPGEGGCLGSSSGVVARLEEENLTLKERLVLMEKELEELRSRVRCLETAGFSSSADACSEKSVGDGE